MIEAQAPVQLPGDDLSRRLHFEMAKLAKKHVGGFWRRTGRLPDDVRRAAFNADRGLGVDDPTAPWSERSLDIDGTPVAFRVLAHDSYWIGQAAHGEVVVAVESSDWSQKEIRLVTVHDLGEYPQPSTEAAGPR